MILMQMHFTSRVIPVVATALLLAALDANSAPVQMMKNVPAGDEARKFHHDPLLKNLNMLLQKGDLEQFYQITRTVIDQHEVDMATETLAGDKMDRQLLIDWYVVTAPFFDLGVDTPLCESCIMYRDIERKNGVMNDLYVISKGNLEQNKSLSRKKEIARLCSIYAAVLIRTLREHYRPNIEEENRNVRREREVVWQKSFHDKWGEFMKEEEQYEKNWKQPASEREKDKSEEMQEQMEAYRKDVWKEGDQRRELANKLGVMEMRNSFIERSFKRREGTLLAILLINYSGQASEVFDYLKMAGYTEEEIMEVVDRTEGRSKKTEFLYKSGLGRKFLKNRDEKIPESRKK